jgi:hypothetical protein
VAETLLAELGLQKSEVRKLQPVPVDRLSGAAAEAIRKTTQPQPAYRDSTALCIRVEIVQSYDMSFIDIAITI